MQLGEQTRTSGSGSVKTSETLEEPLACAFF